MDDQKSRGIGDYFMSWAGGVHWAATVGTVIVYLFVSLIVEWITRPTDPPKQESDKTNP